MKTTKYKIALASACGAAIGYCLGTTFLSGAWLILAVLSGGTCGWIAFDPRGFLKAISQAMREVANETSLKLHELWAEPWGKILPRAFRYAIDPLLVLQVIGTIMVYIVAPFTNPGSTLIVCAVSYGITIGIGSLLSAVIFFQEIVDREARIKTLNRELKQVCVFSGGMSVFKFLALTNPIILPFTTAWLLGKALYSCIRGIAWLVRRIPLVIRFGWLVIVRTCVLAHSNGRLASFAGASLGAIVGVIVGHLAIAMLSGATIGTLANYVGAFFPKAYIAFLVENLKTAKAEIS